MSYLEYDLGYDSGYDTDSIPTSNPATTHAAFSPEGPAVSYQMNPPTVRPRTIDQAAEIYQRVMGQVRGESGSEDATVPGATDLSGDHQGLQGVEQSQRSEGAVGGDPSAQFTPGQVLSQRDQETIDEFTSEGGLLDRQLHWSEGARAMFREQYAGSTREELLDIFRQQGTESTDERSGRIQEQMMRDYLNRMGERVQSRYAPGAISEDSARAIAAQAVRRVLPELNNFQIPAQGERATPETSTSARVLQEINSIPRGSTQTDQVLHRDTVGRARSDFATGTRDIFRSIDRRYYGRGAQGDRRASADAERFLFHRGIQDNPGEINRLTHMDRAQLTRELRQFSQQIRANEGMARELDRQMGRSSVDTSQLTRQQRGQRQLQLERIEAEDRRSERDLAARREEGELNRASQLAVAAVNHQFAMEQQEAQSRRQMAQMVLQTSLQGLSQMIGQTISGMQQQSWAMSQQMFQSTSQQQRPADASTWFGLAGGHGAGGRAA